MSARPPRRFVTPHQLRNSDAQARPALFRTGSFMLDTARNLFTDTAWEQVLPLLVVFVLTPLFALGTYYTSGRTAYWFAMVFENLGLGFAWSWMGNHDTLSSAKDKKSTRKKHMRRADARSDSSRELERYYPGLINISGTYCFLNSTLQAMASLSYLQPHIEAIHFKAERLDVPTPVIDALRDALIELNTPSTSPRALRPISVINALSAPVPGKQRSALFSSREHQDAQELFQLLSESIKNEAKAIDDEASRDRGLGGLSRPGSEEPEAALEREKESGKGVFDGLTANRRSCVECGYTEAVMHFAFDNWQLAVPRMANCRLEDCLADYTRLELLNDCICRRCSMLATHKRLVAEAEKASEAASSEHGASASKKKRAREARKFEARVKAALDESRIEEDIKGIKMEKVFSRCSTKQAMIARPPLVLALHLNRSIHFGNSGVKNTCRVLFPELLDLTPFTTSGQLSTSPSAPISSPAATPPARSTTPTPATYVPRVLYRLSAVVCHYGAHSFGHYVAYRRKPRPPSAGERRFAPPTLRCPLVCECDKCAAFGPIRDEEGGTTHDRGVVEMPAHAASRWLRISDDSVTEMGIESVLAEAAGTFMLYYERVTHPRPSIWPAQSSEETIKPVGIKQEDVGLGLLAEPKAGARIVRSVYAGMSRSPSFQGVSTASSSSSFTDDESDVETPTQGTPSPAPGALSNGDAVHSTGPALLPSMLPSEPTTKSRPTTPQPSPRPPSRQNHRLPSPQPIHAPQPPSPARTVGLRA